MLQDIVILEHQEPNGISGGTFTKDEDHPAKLNTIVCDVGGLCHLANNQFTLAPGTYTIRAWTLGFMVTRLRSWLHNVTNNAIQQGAGGYPIAGSSSYAPSNVGGQPTSFVAGLNWSLVEGVLTITEAAVFELRKRCFATKAGDGHGPPTFTGEGANEVYSRVWLERIGEVS